MAESVDLTDVPADHLPDDPAELRAALIDQLRYLIDEIEALKPIVDRVPASVREGRPTPDELSIKEVYSVIALMDEQVHRPRLSRITADEEGIPAFEPVEEDTLVEGEAWNEKPIEDILERVQSTRQSLVEFLDALPPDAWTQTGRVGGEERTVFEIAHRITQDDTRRLRTIGHRLHASNLTGRDRDLPK